MISSNMLHFKYFLLVALFAKNGFSAPPTISNNDSKISDEIIPEIDSVENNMMTSLKRIWPNNTVYYIIDPSLENYTCLIEEQMEEIMKVTNDCIKFVNSKGVGNYLKIRKTDNICGSLVGMFGGEQELYLAHECINTITILHELMHALGFYHEHNRSDRDEYIEILPDNIQPGEEEQFKKLEQHANYLITKYDFESIMHYQPDISSKNGTKTMVSKVPGEKIRYFHERERESLSKSDIFELKSLYSCPGSTHPPPVHVPDFNCTFESGYCIFDNYTAGYQPFQRVSENGNYVLSAEGKGKFILTSRFIYLQQGEACVQISYKVEKVEGTTFSWITVLNLGYYETVDLQVSKPSEWMTAQVKIKPEDEFQVHIVIRAFGYFSMKIDDFKLSYQPCRE